MAIDLYKDLLGKPYLFGSYGPNTYDCYGLIVELYKRLGINLPKRFPDDNFPSIHENVQNEYEMNWECIEKPVPYCVVRISLVPPYVSHVGMVLEDCKTFIHILPTRNVTIERLDSIIWRRRIAGYAKWKQN